MKLQKYLVAIAISLTIFLPNLAIAQSNTSADTCAQLKQQFSNAGGANVVANVPQYCTVESVYSKFITTALFFVGIVGVVFIVYGGYLYMTA
ncbi:MAG TPA: hypothetical protein VHQ20_02815, partial [Patescibacteria group bacterium]|nr:hypothetical protein [Patescibacteria group bacterium]